MNRADARRDYRLERDGPDAWFADLARHLLLDRALRAWKRQTKRNGRTSKEPDEPHAPRALPAPRRARGEPHPHRRARPANAITIHGPLVTITADGKIYRVSPSEKGKVAWHPKLTKYGAGELNERFLRRTKHAMDEPAYLGWLAVKIVAEAGFRRKEIADVKVDGHKGVALHFDANRNLVQPLYAVPK